MAGRRARKLGDLSFSQPDLSYINKINTGSQLSFLMAEWNAHPTQNLRVQVCYSRQEHEDFDI
jgi:hypothetical protein